MLFGFDHVYIKFRRQHTYSIVPIVSSVQLYMIQSEHERRSILLVYHCIALLIPVTRNFRSSKLRKLADVRGVRSKVVGWAVAHPEFLKKVL
jgi:hypothetical protein